MFSQSVNSWYAGYLPVWKNKYPFCLYGVFFDINLIDSVFIQCDAKSSSN